MKTGYMYAIAAAVTWGLVYALNQKILKSVSPLTMLFFEALLTVLITLPIIVLQTKSLKTPFLIGSPNVGLTILTALLWLMANFFILVSIQQLNASTAAVLEISYPFFVVIFSYLLFRSPITISFALGAVLIFAGSVLIIRSS